MVIDFKYNATKNLLSSIEDMKVKRTTWATQVHKQFQAGNTEGVKIAMSHKLAAQNSLDKLYRELALLNKHVKRAI